MSAVLVVEDDPHIRENVAELLEAEGFTVATAPDGASGLEAAQRSRPDLVVCDVSMPGLDGFEVLRQLRAGDPGGDGPDDGSAVPFLFLTARAGHADRRRAMGAGADDYLVKPFTADDLLAAVRALLDKRSRARERERTRLDELRAHVSEFLPHELGTPLTVVLSASRLLRDNRRELPEAEVDALLDGVHQAGRELERLVEDYALYLHLHVGRGGPALGDGPTPDAAAVVARRARAEAVATERAGDLRLSLAAGPAALPPQALGKVVEAVVGNAFKFSAPGTPVEVGLHRSPGGWALSVADRGRGMTTEEVRRLGAFLQFGREADERPGLGLGLAVARGLVERHGGTVEVESAPGAGTTVRVRLPAGPAPGA